MEEFLKFAIPAFTGLIAGAIGSIVAPWVQWGIEKRKLRPFLSERTREEIESDTITVQLSGRGSGTNNYKPHVLDELRTLASKWKLL